MPFALVDEAGRVNQIEQDQSDTFPVADGLEWLPCGSEVTLEYTWDGAQFVAPAEPTLDETKRQAEFTLEQYYKSYSQSQFNSNGDTFPADDPVAFLVIAEVMRKEPSNTNQAVFDILGVSHPILSTPQWNTFWSDYVSLFDEARGITGQASADIEAATTNAEVQAVLDALPPIPGA